MSINAVNTYNTSSSSTASTSSDKSTISTSDFLKMLSVQLSNQDVLNPTDNTEFISQMAQITSLQAIVKLADTATSQLQAIEVLSNQNSMQYGASLVGKSVVVSSTDADGKPIQTKGVVDSVHYGSDSYTISVNGTDYDLSSVMEVYQ